MYMAGQYGKTALIGFVAGTSLFALFALVTGCVWPSVMDAQVAIIRLLICAGAGILIAFAITAVLDASARRE